MDSKHLSIGMKAPDFYAQTTQGTMKLSDFKGEWLVFFSHPGDLPHEHETNKREKKSINNSFARVFFLHIIA